MPFGAYGWEITSRVGSGMAYNTALILEYRKVQPTITYLYSQHVVRRHGSKLTVDSVRAGALDILTTKASRLKDAVLRRDNKISDQMDVIRHSHAKGYAKNGAR